MYMTVPRFSYTYCSQCGASFGPGDHGISHCWDHPGKRERMAAKYRLIVGYDPIADDPTITNAELAALLDDVTNAHERAEVDAS